ncbi:MAG TPA: pyridoxamine 5'-phosphate oxidase family protein [Blastocatellia bacterium]|nr:pyridoxamine 5'-phosphate oxidase family protein [Blastocatellia bacterium]
MRFIREHRLAVEASVSRSLAAQAAVVGFAISDEFEIIFDTLDSTRKVANIRQNPKVAFTVGGLTSGDERTVQYEGLADEPSGVELERLTEIYYGVYPDGRARRSWPGLIFVRVRPTWIRYSDYNVDPPQIVEFSADQLPRKA